MSAELPHKLPVVFYRTPAGSEVVRNWLRELDQGDRNAVGQDLMRVQYRWPVGMPLCRAMGDGLWEIRSDLPSNRIARVLSMASSRNRRRRRTMTWPWPVGATVNSVREVLI